MPRLRTWAILIGGASAALMVLHHARDSAGLETPGGIIMDDAAGYNLLSRVLLGSFYGSVAADVDHGQPEEDRDRPEDSADDEPQHGRTRFLPVERPPGV
jgi:hypothetical protein